MQIHDHPTLKAEARNLNFFYGEAKALKGINMPIYDKKVTALIGPSGCGKSTYLRSFNRMHDLYPGNRYEGEIRFFPDNTNLLDEEVDPIEVRALPWMHPTTRRAPFPPRAVPEDNRTADRDGPPRPAPWRASATRTPTARRERTGAASVSPITGATAPCSRARSAATTAASRTRTATAARTSRATAPSAARRIRAPATSASAVSATPTPTAAPGTTAAAGPRGASVTRRRTSASKRRTAATSRRA